MAESPAPMADRSDRVDLPAGWQPEGITSLGGSLFVGSLADGAIWRVDAATREGEVFVPGTDGAVAVGVEADEANGRIWVAGGNTGLVRAYAADSGELLQTYAFVGGFLNDLVATREAVYVTDSNVQQLGVIPLGADGSLPDPSAATTLPLSGDLVYQEDAFNANGIVAAPVGLILVQSGTGGLFRVDPATGRRRPSMRATPTSRSATGWSFGTGPSTSRATRPRSSPHSSSTRPSPRRRSWGRPRKTGSTSPRRWPSRAKTCGSSTPASAPRRPRRRSTG